MDKRELAAQARALKGCIGGLQQLRGCNTPDELIKCYFDRIDFCLANNFPSNEFIKKYSGRLAESGIYVDKRWIFENQNKLVLLGKSDIEVNFDGYTVSRIYAKHNTQLIINACDNSFVLVDALDDVNVRVNLSDNAKVVVNLYGNAYCLGASKTIKKNRETYDLQTE